MERKNIRFINTDFLKNEEIQLRLEETSDADEEKGWVPIYHFAICNNKGIKIGICDLRIGYNERMYYRGNIGYSIDKKYRGNHFAGKACLLLFELAKMHHMEYLIITCNPDNHASKKTCEYVGGEFIEEVDLPEDNEMRVKGETRKCIFKVTLGEKKE